jgi:2-polyprenyl-3-methyl-5-hydroxy-6-metoxy-1,4-benzoquinol methylase
MEQYWNERFKKERNIWGVEPSKITIICEEMFRKNNIKTILIMGVGYGRNGKYFTDRGYTVDGIEVADEAIKIGEIFAPKIKYIKGSVLEIKSRKKYDAIFCFDIIHLFRKKERNKIIENCIKQINKNGIIMISCFSTDDKTYGVGPLIEKNTYEVKKDKIVHFFEQDEMENIDKGLEIINIDKIIEKIKTEEREVEYKIIYGIYRKK